LQENALQESLVCHFGTSKYDFLRWKNDAKEKPETSG